MDYKDPLGINSNDSIYVTRFEKLGKGEQRESRVKYDHSFMKKMYGFNDEINSEDYIFYRDGGIVSYSTKVEIMKNKFNPVKKGNNVVKGYDIYNGVLLIDNKSYNTGLFTDVHCINLFNDAHIQLLTSHLKKGKPNVKVVVGDIKDVILRLPEYSSLQVLSNFNSMANKDQWKDHMDGIEEYKYNDSTASRMALSFLSSTVTRNYYLPEMYQGEYNSLTDLDIKHINGFLIWCNDSEEMSKKAGDWSSIRLVIMLNAEIECVKPNDKVIIRKNSPITLINTPIMMPNNVGNKNADSVAGDIAFQVYGATIAFSLALHIIKMRVLGNASGRPTVNLVMDPRQSKSDAEIILEILEGPLGTMDYDVNVYIDLPSEDFRASAEELASVFPKPVAKGKSPAKPASPARTPAKPASPARTPAKPASPTKIRDVEEEPKVIPPGKRPETKRSAGIRGDIHRYRDADKEDIYVVSLENDDPDDYLVLSDVEGTYVKATVMYGDILSKLLAFHRRDAKSAVIKQGNNSYSLYKQYYTDPNDKEDFFYILRSQYGQYIADTRLYNKYSPWMKLMIKKGPRNVSLYKLTDLDGSVVTDLEEEGGGPITDLPLPWMKPVNLFVSEE